MHTDSHRERLRARHNVEDFRMKDDVADGMKKDRSCTDICCCLLFVVVMLGYFAIMVYSFAYTDLVSAIQPLLKASQNCKSSEKLLICNSNILNPPGINPTQFDDYSFCWSGSACPTKGAPLTGRPSSSKCPLLAEEDYTTMQDLCVNGTNSNENSYQALIIKKVQDDFEKYYNEYKHVIPVVAIVIGVGFGVGFVWMLIMRFLARCIATIATLAALGSLVVLGVYLLQQLSKYQSGTNQYTGLIVGAVICFTVVFIFLLCLCCHRKYLCESLDFVEAASQFVSSNLHGIIVPVLTFIITVLFLGVTFFSVISMFNLTSANKIGDVWNVEMTGTAKFMVIFTLVAFYWFAFYLVYLCEYIIICGACHWYFAFRTNEQGKANFCTGFCWGIGKNAGSVAFAAFLSMILGVIRAIVHNLEERAGNNGAAKCIACMVNCCLLCLKNIIDYLNKNGLVQVALTGENFCTSAYHGFMLVLSNPIQFAIVEFIGHFFMMLSSLAIAMITTLLGYVIMQHFDTSEVSIYAMLGVMFAEGLVIGHLFMSLYKVSLTAILQCFLVSCTAARQGNTRIEDHTPPVLQEWIVKIHSGEMYNQTSSAQDPKRSPLIKNNANSMV